MRSLTIILAVFFPLLLFAGNGIWERRVNLLDVQTGYTYSIQEPVRVNQDTRLVSKLKGYLFLDYTRKEQSDLAVAAPANYWRMWVKYRVGVDPTVRELRISYENGNYVYSDYSEVTISNTGYDIIIDKVEGEYSSNGSSWTNVSNAANSPFIPNDIDLRLELRSETVYAMDPGIGATADMSRLNFNSTTFRVNWSFVEGAEWYDLEWVFIDKYSQEYTALSTGLSSDYDLAFDKKAATRVRVWGTNYVLDKAYPEGTLYFRVRSVSNFTENGSSVDQIKLGNWSYFYDPATVGATVELSELVRYEIGTAQEFEPNKNWLYGVAFAQEGKSVSSVTYYDGSNRGRQGITYNTSDNVSLVGESKFDREGRQTLSIIPAPVSGRQLGYRTNFNLSSGGGTTVAFDEEDFDFSNPETVVAAVSTTSGAGKYFSTNNDFSSDLYRAAIPNAQGYVYSQTIYRNDGSGRIERVGGIGADFKASGDRAIRTYYGSATEAELKRLFGDNISDNPEGYRKELVRDANGQYSVTYYDKRGHVIATALAGDAPSNLRALEGINDESITTDLSDNNIVVGGTQIISEHTFLNTVPNNSITLNYNLTGAVNTLASQSFTVGNQSISIGQLCTSCHYDLKIQVVKADGSAVINTYTSSIDPAGCAAGTGSYTSPAITLVEPGEYRIIKTLTVDQDAMVAAFNDLLASQNLLNSSAFIQSYIAQVDLTGCFTNCDDYCKALWKLNYIQVNTSTDALAEIAWNNLSTSARNQYLSDCNADVCNPDELYEDFGDGEAVQPDACSAYRELAINQIMPGGALYDDVNSSFWDAFPVTINNQTYTASQVQNPLFYTHEIAGLFVDNGGIHRESCHLGTCAIVNNSNNYSAGLAVLVNNTAWSTSSVVFTQPYDNDISGWTEDPFKSSVINGSSLLQSELNNYMANQYAALPGGTFWGCSGTSWPTTGTLLDYVELYAGCVAQQNSGMTAAEIEQMKKSLFLGAYNALKNKLTDNYKSATGCTYYSDDNALFRKLNESSFNELAAETLSNILNPQNCDGKAWNQTTLWMNQLPVSCLESLGMIQYVNGIPQATYTATDLQNAYTGTGGATVNTLAEYLYAYSMKVCATNTWGWFYDPGTGNPGKTEYDAALSILNSSPCLITNPQNLFGVNPAPTPVVVSVTNQQFSDCFHEFVQVINDGLAAYNSCSCTSDTLYVTSATHPDMFMNCQVAQSPGNLVPGTLQVTTSGGSYVLIYQMTNGSCRSTLALQSMVAPYLPFPSSPRIVSLSNPVKQVLNNANIIVFDAALENGTTVKVFFDTKNLQCMDFGSFGTQTLIPTGGITVNLPDYQTDCIHAETAQAEIDGQTLYNQMLETLWNQFQSSSSTNCLNVTETLRMTYHLKEYQYTLYYYDLAGNLVQTVPPQGVAVLDAGQLSAMETDAPDNKVFPAHKMETRYEYNGLNSLIASYTPDGGRSNLYLDKLYRVRYSQNARQAAAGTASYSKYDPLGRVTEAGEFKIPAGDNLALKTNDANYPTSGIMDYTHTYYEEGYTSDATIAAVFGASGQENLRNAIGAVVHRQADYDASGNVISGTQTITVLSYSYDAHKNVKQLVSTNSRLADIGQQHKKVEYDYDLISGNVEEVVYQAGAADEYRHRYHYDANNRLVRAFTSKNNVQWEMDAKYFYYLHGSLARTETGHDKVQGSDYAYNLQGWLKGVNSATLVNSRDIGKDGSSGLNQWSGADVFGYQLGYYTGDYTAIGNGFSAFATTTDLTALNLNPDVGANNGAAMGSLYNGNITHMVTAIRDYNENVIDILGNNYQYDQLQRIRSMKANYTATLASSNNFSGAGLYRGVNGEGAYQESYEFDKNGNLKSLKRNGSGRNDSGGTVALAMDDFTYKYYETIPSAPGSGVISGTMKETNRLAHVIDGISNDAYAGDVETGQSGENYVYDLSGQLVQDVQEDIELIEWTVTGKVKKITFTSEGKSLGKNDVKFMYDPMDMRVAKMEYVSDPENPEAAAAELRYTYYTYDAGGNVMATYSRVINKTGQTASQRTYGDNFRLDEQMIYGSSRVGTENQKSGVYMVSATITQPIAQPEDIERALGYVWSGTGALTFDNTKRVVSDKTYELSNHLGNVLAVVTDRKIKDPKASEPYNETFTYADGTATGSGWQGQAWSGCSTIATLSYENNKLKTTVYCHGGNRRFFDVVPGETYTVSFDLASVNGNIPITFYKSDLPVANGGLGPNLGTYSITANNHYEYNFTATDEWLLLAFYTYSSNSSFTLDNFKITNHKKYVADVVSYSDYSPYGTLLNHRHGTQTGSDSYRYKFQGMESDDDVKGDGNSYTTEFRQYDPRIGRWLSLDPLMAKFPHQSPYVAFDNNPIYFTDPQGAASGGPGDPPTVVETTAETHGFNGSIIYNYYGGNATTVNNWWHIYIPEGSTVFRVKVEIPESTLTGPQHSENVVYAFETGGVTYSWNNKAQWYVDKNGNEYDDTWNNDMLNAGIATMGGFFSFAFDAGLEKMIKAAEKSNMSLGDYFFYQTFMGVYQAGKDIYNGGHSRTMTILSAWMTFNPLSASFSFSPIKQTVKGVLSRTERLSMFKNNLSKAANPSNPKDALSLINKTLDDIELKHAGVDDRMFGILDDKYVTYHSNGSVTALTKGHRIEIQSNGMFSIFERKTGDLFFSK